jgi:hypothetical protein
MSDLTMQQVFSRLQKYQIAMGYDPTKMTIEEKMVAIRDYHTALAIEQTELLQELPWKPWRPIESQSTKGPLNSDFVVDEWTDCLVFLIDQALVLGITGEQVECSFTRVMDKCLSRIEAGYSQKRKKHYDHTIDEDHLADTI